jgi:hypothetical protein
MFINPDTCSSFLWFGPSRISGEKQRFGGSFNCDSTHSVIGGASKVASGQCLSLRRSRGAWTTDPPLADWTTQMKK